MRVLPEPSASRSYLLWRWRWPRRPGAVRASRDRAPADLEPRRWPAHLRSPRRLQRDRRPASPRWPASGDPRAADHHRGAAGRAAAIQRRAEEGLLQGQGRQAVRGRDRRSRSQATSPPISPTVDINNRLRRAIDAALGGLTLAGARSRPGGFEAAQAVFKSRERERAAGARRRARQGNRRARQAGADRGARRRRSCIPSDASRGRQARPRWP